MATQPPAGPSLGPSTPSIPETETVPSNERNSRRLLVGLIVFLVLAAIGLIVLLFWLLRPEDEPDSLTLPTECPIDSVDSIYGYGPEVEELLLHPLAVSFDPAGDVWVSDTGHGRLLEFDRDGELLTMIGQTDELGALASPYGIDFSDDGERIYVADWTQGAILVYSADGRYVEHFPAADQDLTVFGDPGFSPYDVHVWGSQVVVASNDGIYFFDRTGHVIDRWGGETRGAQPGEFAFPDALTVDEETGNVYVADTLNRRVVALNSDGDVLWISGTPDDSGQITGFWQLPRSITLGPDGRLYVVDTFRAQDKCAGVGHIVVLDTNGDLVSEFGAAGRDELTFNFPEKLAVTPDGTFGLADRENSRAVLFTLGPLPGPDPLEQESYDRSFQRFDN